ncbi:MAG: hypothetical protein JW862_01255 [Anaerolineales bacterium]|nr:hypothetical protein [Anaerolineales bacterium]
MTSLEPIIVSGTVLSQLERNYTTTQAVTKIILARLDDPSLSIECSTFAQIWT